MFVVMALAFGITWAGFKSFTSPQQLAFTVKNTLNGNSIYRSIAKIKTNDTKTINRIDTFHPIVKYVEAKEEKTVLYKGKLLKVKVFDQNDQPSQTVLEILYNIELEKERQQK
jgi:hypothetical protein